MAETRDRFLLETNGMNNSAVLDRTVQQSLDEMDETGVETAMLSLNNPGLTNRELARHANEFAARVRADHPRRFGHLASLPMRDTEGSLKEIAYALDVLKADGFFVHTSDDDRWHGDSSYFPIYEELNRRNAVLMVHPASALCCQRMNVVYPPALIEYPIDTTRAITNWIYSGAAQRFPNIRLIHTHGGGSTLTVFDRIKAVTMVAPHLKENLPQGKDAIDVLRSFFYDTAICYNKTAIAAMRDALPLSQILFGSDQPYWRFAPEISALTGLLPNTAEFRAVARDNALTLFPRLA